jgi:hypothetical protein
VPLDTAQCVLPIPFRLIKKAVRGSIGHERHLDNNTAGGDHFTAKNYWRINDLLNNIPY